MLCGVSYNGVSSWYTAMYVDVMYDNVTDILNGYARTIRNLDFFLQVDDHVLIKGDPQRLFLDDTIAERAWNWVYRRLPSRPPTALRPNPIAQSASTFLLVSQSGSHLQQSSIGGCLENVVVACEIRTRKKRENVGILRVVEGLMSVLGATTLR
ncbi:hypothetical protein NC651_026958 [Populus alba x Populus x berolinensis]|nr:hypothetical protein NC651_026958 [Populus alba x Populus x berolinensis]